jgi:hypothetical protein
MSMLGVINQQLPLKRIFERPRPLKEKFIFLRRNHHRQFGLLSPPKITKTAPLEPKYPFEPSELGGIYEVP